jgi:hypothetical protein
MLVGDRFGHAGARREVTEREPVGPLFAHDGQRSVEQLLAAFGL